MQTEAVYLFFSFSFLEQNVCKSSTELIPSQLLPVPLLELGG